MKLLRGLNGGLELHNGTLNMQEKLTGFTAAMSAIMRNNVNHGCMLFFLFLFACVFASRRRASASMEMLRFKIYFLKLFSHLILEELKQKNNEKTFSFMLS